MKSLKRKALRFLPLLVLPLSLAVVATRVKSAAEFPNPCMGDEYRSNVKRTESGGVKSVVASLTSN